MVFNRRIEHGDHHARYEQRPPEQGKQQDRCFHPVELENVRPHIAHHGEKIRHCIIDAVVIPLQHGIENDVGYLLPQGVEYASDSVPDP